MYLGKALRLQGKVAEALTFVSQARTQLESLVTLQHPWAALALIELGEMYRSGSRYMEAIEVRAVSNKNALYCRSVVLFLRRCRRCSGRWSKRARRCTVSRA
jgi:hypothetical protein